MSPPFPPFPASVVAMAPTRRYARRAVRDVISGIVLTGRTRVMTYTVVDHRACLTVQVVNISRSGRYSAQRWRLQLFFPSIASYLRTNNNPVGPHEGRLVFALN